MEEQQRLQNLLRLQSTEAVKAKLETIRVDPQKRDDPHYGTVYYEDLLNRCHERDALQTERPEGCCCLGTGTRDCPCLDGIAYRRQEKEHQLTERAKSRNKRRIERWADANIPRRFEDYRLLTSPVLKTQPELVRALTYPGWDDIDDDAALERFEKWNASWFLWGPYGTGKTGLAIAYGWEQIHQGPYEPVNKLVFRTAPDLLADIRATMDSGSETTESEIMERYLNTNVLLLDDLGAERVTGWVEERLYRVIGHRHAEMLTTVFTSNLSPEELGQKLGERIVWRIVEMCGAENIVEIKGPNLRDQ